MSGASRILAFDTSATHCGAALLIGGRIVATRQDDMGRGQAERLFPMLEEVLTEVGAVWEELDAIGVGIGPGNFTGVRISVSAARGLAMSLGIPAVGVSGFEALLDVQGLRDGEPQIVSLPSTRGWFLQRYEAGEAIGLPIEKLRNGGYSSDDLERFRGVPVLGYDAAMFGDLTEFAETSRDAAFDNVAGMRIAERIARVAGRKLASGQPIPRPSPVYVRPADAAPASDAPPVILP